MATIRSVALNRVRDLIRDAMPDVTVRRMAFERLPEASLPAAMILNGAEEAPLPGEHDAIGGANVRMHVAVALYARAAGTAANDDEELSDRIEELRGRVIAAVGQDPTLGGLVQWLVYSGCDAAVSASDSSIATVGWLLHFTALRPEAELDAYHPTAA